MRISWKVGPRWQGKVKTNRARTLRRNMTDAERKLWKVLRGQQLDRLKFRRQVPFGPFYLDFYCASHRVAIELDGGQHYFGKGAARDALRDRYLHGAGLTVLRYSDREILLNSNGVAEDIFQKLLTPTLSSLRRGGRCGAPLLEKERVG